ncbi:hypothetical protein [Bdellovibrio bacteriovorus]|uniref:Uncharacterized protein n=1 Tax=Bdellovibrio bacteriovorus TaxID=959 RepID=A0A150WBT7_BDEBC|nr:hypothetical protein [Bdellovibrio bacteriovorus]KYG60406.1 hypothetical protein AZI85_13125 [Bdellovibrio bacteriovorus]
MRILYFTDGAGIDLQGIRESVLRIPEVLTSLRRGQEQARYVDLMQVMGLPDEDFRQVSSVLRNFLINLVQRGLHQRWINRDHRADLILRRINHRNFSDIKNEVLNFIRAKSAGQNVATQDLHLLHFLSHVEITIIGPGYDEIEIWLRREISNRSDIKVLIKDVIASDPQLDWFWPQVREAVTSGEMPLI